jgi:copper chaperone CopZ
MNTTITILGTHCVSCKALIEEVCNELPGVDACTVDFKTGKTTIEHDDTFKLAALARELASLGEYRIQEQS